MRFVVKVSPPYEYPGDEAAERMDLTLLDLRNRIRDAMIAAGMRVTGSGFGMGSADIVVEE